MAVDAFCAICGKPPNTARWSGGDAWCHGCQNFICFDCHIAAPTIVPRGPHSLDVHKKGEPQRVDIQAEFDKRHERKEETEMPIIATAGSTKKYTPAPAGLHNGVCVDVVDLGLEPNRFDSTKPDVHKVRIIWEIDEKNPENEGAPFTVAGKWTLSLHKKASLRGFLASWRGRDFTKEEEDGFDVEKLVGQPCMVNVLHNVGEDGTTYANVASVSQTPKGTKHIKPSAGYVRVKDRPPKEGAVAAKADEDPQEAVPF